MAAECDDRDDVTPSFLDLVCIENMQSLQDHLALTARMGSVIIDIEGNYLTKPSHHSSFCHLMQSSQSKIPNCFFPREKIKLNSPKGYLVRKCQETGLWRGMTEIQVKGKVLAYWLIGQTKEGSFPEERIKKFTTELGLDEREFIKAYEKVPIVTEEHFHQLTRLLQVLSNQIVHISYQNYRKKVILKKKEQDNQAIIKSEAFLKTLISTIPDYLWLKDTKGVFLYCNPQLEKVLGRKSEEILGKTDYELMPRDQAEIFHERDRIVVESGESSHNEDQMLFPSDNTLHLIETIKTPIYGDRGDLTGVLGIGRDITKQRKAEAEVINNNALWQDFLNSADNIMGLLDRDGRIQTINEGALKYTRWKKKEELEGQSLLEHSNFLNDEKEILKKRFKSVIETGKPEVFEHNFLLDEELLWLNLRIFKAGDGVGFIADDITTMKTLESQLLQVQKMDSIGRLAGGIAHDFNNILDIIMGYTDMARDLLPESNEAAEYLSEIKRAALKSSTLVRQLLTFARKQTINPVILDLNRAIRGMLSMLRKLLKRSIELRWTPVEEVCPIKIDPVQMDQILANICVNARDAMDQSGGYIRINTSRLTVDKDFTALCPESVPGEYILLTVEDNGKGMDSQTLDRIFEPFFTTKEIDKGTGLGLSTVYGIMKQNEGFIQILSELGVGTTVNLFFPCAREE
ncbi:MAG: PocR ligand-binding domain-containing protein [Spirochaetales bacterium]|nr:PocR ligand-binding domain-containing protein [Spirochaetales bacterium]